MRYLLKMLIPIFLAGSCAKNEQKALKASVEQKNFIFILSDDHRYDFMGFTGKVPFLETPNMERMAYTSKIHPHD